MTMGISGGDIDFFCYEISAPKDLGSIVHPNIIH